MNKLIITFLLVNLLINASVKNALADALVAESSASLSGANPEIQKDNKYRTELLRKYLNEVNSPLSNYSKEFVEYADKYQIDWRLLPAISGVESTYGKAIPFESYNAYGWANGKYKFKSWDDSIETVSKALREKYIDKGANTIEKISTRYAPPSTTWAGKVKFIIKKIDPLPVTFDL